MATEAGNIVQEQRHRRGCCSHETSTFCGVMPLTSRTLHARAWPSELLTIVDCNMPRSYPRMLSSMDWRMRMERRRPAARTECDHRGPLLNRHGKKRNSQSGPCQSRERNS
ncbi:uncharacterized protein [Dermacentor albipictus]|uniref:uncharacterized protein n=1 Tax=Dermacentor albipictus TaxID=60249 RepID=UPI0038FD12C4